MKAQKLLLDQELAEFIFGTPSDPLSALEILEGLFQDHVKLFYILGEEILCL